MFVRESRFYTPSIVLSPPEDWLSSLKRLVKALRRDDIKTVDALLAYVARDYVTSRIVAQLLFQWLPRAKRDDGLVYKSGADWQAETGISEGQVKTRKGNGALGEMGVFWKVIRANKIPHTHYGIDAEKFVAHVAKCVGKMGCDVRAIVFDKAIRPDIGADQPRPQSDSAFSLTDSHKQSQFVGVNDDSPSSEKILTMDDPLLAKLVRAGLKRSSFSERYRQLPDAIIDQCIADTREAKKANEIKYTVNAYLRGALENQVEQYRATPSQFLPTGGEDEQERAVDETWHEPEKCPDCGQVPHWFSKKCGCTEDTLSEASDVDVEAVRVWDAAYNQLQLQLDRASFDTWLRPAVLLRVDDGVFVIGVHNSYAQDMLSHRLYRNVRRVLSDVIGETTELRFEIKG